MYFNTKLLIHVQGPITESGMRPLPPPHPFAKLQIRPCLDRLVNFIDTEVVCALVVGQPTCEDLQITCTSSLFTHSTDSRFYGDHLSITRQTKQKPSTKVGVASPQVSNLSNLKQVYLTMNLIFLIYFNNSMTKQFDISKVCKWGLRTKPKLVKIVRK